jgi:uncharacterized RDD family membrane protein YckC
MQVQEGASYCPHCGFSVSVAQIGPVYVPQSAPLPQTIPAAPPVTVALARPVYAGFWLRAVAFMIDSIILSTLFGLISTAYPSELMIFPDATTTPSILAIPRLTLPGFLLLFLIMWIYYGFFEASSWQATPGKRLLRLYVTDLSGKQITFWRASLRYFGRKISELTFLVGYLLAGFTEKKQALHDIISSCLVLRRP